MMTDKDMAKIVEDTFALFASDGRDLVSAWIAKDIIDRHSSGLADDENADFFRWCGYRAVREAVKKYVQNMSPAKSDRAPLLPGLKHVQQCYSIERNGETCVVQTVLASDDELLAKAAEIQAMGDTCIAHADELRRFVKGRRAAGAA